jgi:hypothetical protein
MIPPSLLERKIERILRTRGQGLGLTAKRIRLILNSLGYDASPAEIGWRLMGLRRKGRVVKAGRRLWKLVTYGGT